MRLLIPSLLLITLCGCAAQEAAKPRQGTPQQPAELSLEQMSAQPEMSRAANFAARREIRIRHIAAEAFPPDTAVVTCPCTRLSHLASALTNACNRRLETLARLTRGVGLG
jgi:hypothetical protein